MRSSWLGQSINAKDAPDFRQSRRYFFVNPRKSHGILPGFPGSPRTSPVSGQTDHRAVPDLHNQRDLHIERRTQGSAQCGPSRSGVGESADDSRSCCVVCGRGMGGWHRGGDVKGKRACRLIRSAPPVALADRLGPSTRRWGGNTTHCGPTRRGTRHATGRMKQRDTSFSDQVGRLVRPSAVFRHGVSR